MKVLVYGSLRKGFGNHYLLENSRFLGEVKTGPHYTMYSFGGFPALSLNGDTTIVGEVYEVDEETMARLDRLEGYPNFYDRVLIPTEYGEAWMYFIHDIDREALPVVESGDWKEYRNAV